MSTCGNGCGNGSHLAAVHIQNTPAGGSGSDWNGPTSDSFTPSVPEPSSMLLLGSAFVLLGGAMRQQCKRVHKRQKTAMRRQGALQVDFGDPLPCVAMPRHRT
jgi:PEP-CTERM motif